MLTPAQPSPDERGQRWLQAQVQQILAASTMIAQCGSGLYPAQHNAIMFIRRTLRKLGIVPA